MSEKNTAVVQATSYLRKDQGEEELKPGRVLAWLHENPDFVAAHAEALSALLPKNEGNVTHLHAARAERVIKQSEDLGQRHYRLLRIAEANSKSAAALFELVVDLLQTSSVTMLRALLQQRLQGDFDIDAVRLWKVGPEATATALPAGDIDAWFEADSLIRLRRLSEVQEREIYGAKGKMMQSDALLRLRGADGKTYGMLALASHQEDRFHEAMGQELLTFFARVVGLWFSRLQWKE